MGQRSAKLISGGGASGRVRRANVLCPVMTMIPGDRPLQRATGCSSIAVSRGGRLECRGPGVSEQSLSVLPGARASLAVS